MDDVSVTPGVRRVVEILRARMFSTVDSGDGKSNGEMDCALPWPNVSIQVHPSIMIMEAHRLKRLMNEYGVALCPMSNDPTLPSIQATYDPTDETAMITLVGVDDSLLRR